MNNVKNKESQMNTLYKSFINTMNIDPKTGFIKNTQKKLATLPFIGSKYGEKRRILFIGMDIGCDEHSGITSINQRRNDIENIDFNKLNPHIAGTYFLSMFFLRKEKEYQKIWNEVVNIEETCQSLLKNYGFKLGLKDVDNCLSYVSLTNYFKFVTVNREKRAGDLDRNYMNKKEEISLLEKEIEILDPEVIFLQSQSFLNFPIKCNNKIKVIVGNHPSSREAGTRIPINMIQTAVQIIREIS